MKVIPAPCLVAPSSLSIGEAIERMQKAQTSYILLINEDKAISGIFTDRDILKKFQMLSKDGQTQHPIHTVMSKPVKTLPLRLMHTSAEFMKVNDIRHVPIISNDEEESKVVGILTRRNLFRAYVDSKGMPIIYTQANLPPIHRNIGALSPDGSIHSLLEKIVEQSQYLSVQRLMFSDMQSSANIESVSEQLDAIVIDIDEAREGLWSPVVKYFIENPKVENVCVVYTKDKHPNLIGIMEKLESHGLLEVYEKPIDIGGLILDLENTWASRNQSED